jgi:5-methylcytosine-specific restriction protein A
MAKTPRIPFETVKQAYIMAKQVYNNEINKSHAIESLHKEYDLNKNSARIYIDNFRHLVEGEGYKRSMKIVDTQYFLEQILKNCGEDVFKKALYAIEQHIEYLKSKNRSPNVEQLHNDFERDCD